MKKIVRVRWLDSIGGGPEWQPAAETKPKRRDLRHTTVGFLVHETKLFVVVCGSRQDVSTSVHGCIVIPRRAIASMRKVGS